VDRLDLGQHRARCPREKAPAAGPAGGPRPIEGARNGRWSRRCPLNRLSELRDVAPYYYDWLRHPPDDPFWNFAELRNKYGRTNAAVLNLSGWNDDNYGPEGAITNFLGLVQARAGKPSRAALLLGPWVHGVDATARTKFGDRDFGPAAVIDYDEVVLGWMDRYLRDEHARRACGCGALLRDGRQPVADVGQLAASRKRTPSTTCRRRQRAEARRTGHGATRGNDRGAEQLPLQPGRTRHQSVPLVRRPRLPAVRGAKRRAHLRFGAARA
jgi:predicted acyl esterase